MAWTARARVAAVVGVLLSAGCAEATCERLCQWFEDVRVDREDDGSWEGCQATCEDDYGRAQNYCRDSLNDASACVADVEAGDDPLDEASAGECGEEIERARDDCACGMEAHSETCAALNGARP
jgi:hypothetical protein